ncbi:hypothetical protein MNBD_CHLOROFLEXI01-704, partial [hydrothermal vent metagenome]
RIWSEAEVVSISVPSGVSDMPMTDEETLAGAKNRAIAARSALDAHFGIGLEGGVHPEPFGLVLQGWVVIVDGNGRTGIGGGGRLLLPDQVARRILAGTELGDIIDDILNDHNSKQKGGAVGAFTNGLVMREDSFALAVAYALAPFMFPDFY